MISIVIPVYNESESISLFLDEVRKSILKLKENFEIICFDDGGTDITLELLKNTKKNREVKIIKLSRNFGKEIVLSCGLDYAKGDIVIIMDADFQHPVSLILELYEAHKAQDYEVVLAKRINRQKENFINKSLAYLFYKIHFKLFFVFKSKISLSKALKYFGLQLFALVVSIAITSNLLSLSLYIQILICVAIMPIIIFVINKAWIF